MRKYIGFILGLFIIVLGASFILFYKFYLDQRIDTEKVVVAVKEIPFKEQITEDMVQLQQRKVNQIVPSSFHSIKEVIGKQSTVAIVPNTQLYGDLIDNFGVVPNKDESIFPLPDRWIYAKPGSLRRTYKIDIYAISDPDTQKKLEGKSTEIKQSLESGIKSVESNLGIRVGEPVLKDVVVAYVKDGSNKEVVGTNTKDARLDATGNIVNLDVILTKEKYDTLIKKHIEAGEKLIISYK